MDTRGIESKLFKISFLSNKDKSVIQQKISKQTNKKAQNRKLNVIAVNIDTSHSHRGKQSPMIFNGK